MRLSVAFVIACVLIISLGPATWHLATAQDSFSSGDTTSPSGGETFGGTGGNQDAGIPTPHWSQLETDACDQGKSGYTQSGCDQQLCDHNPDLDICAQFRTPLAPGLKNIQRSPPPDATPQQPPNFPAMALTMSGCLHAKLDYVPVQALQPQYQNAARQRLAVTAPMETPFAQLPAGSQIALTEYAMALQMQAFHDSLYGEPARSDSQYQPVEYLVGWFDYCLRNASLVPPGDPRIRFGKFLGDPVVWGAGPVADPRLQAFFTGYQWGDVAPLSLTPPSWPNTPAQAQP